MECGCNPLGPFGPLSLETVLVVALFFKFSWPIWARTAVLTTGQHVMLVDIGLKAKGKRKDGRWERNSGASHTPGSGGMGKGWTQRMGEAGVILDWGGEVRQKMVSGDQLAAKVKSWPQANDPTSSDSQPQDC